MRAAGHLGRHSPAAAKAMVASNLVNTLTGLVTSRSHTSQVCGLRELGQLSLAADAIASQLLTPRLLAGLVVQITPVPLFSRSISSFSAVQNNNGSARVSGGNQVWVRVPVQLALLLQYQSFTELCATGDVRSRYLHAGILTGGVLHCCRPLRKAAESQS